MNKEEMNRSISGFYSDVKEQTKVILQFEEVLKSSLQGDVNFHSIDVCKAAISNITQYKSNIDKALKLFKLRAKSRMSEV